METQSGFYIPRRQMQVRAKLATRSDSLSTACEWDCAGNPQVDISTAEA
jgi:hypothetical protein